MGIEHHRHPAFGEWQHAVKLLIAEFEHDEDHEDPAVEVPPPHVHVGAGGHETVERAGRTHVPVDARVAKPKARINRKQNDSRDDEPLPRR